MTTKIRKVYTGNDLDVGIFQEDSSGNPIGIADAARWNVDTDTPLLSYCFFDTVEVSASLVLQKRPATGDPFQRIVTQQYDYSARVGNLYFKQQEADRLILFNRETRLRIYMRHYNVYQEDQQILIHAIGATIGITTPVGNEICTVHAEFQAEEYTDYKNAS